MCVCAFVPVGSTCRTSPSVTASRSTVFGLTAVELPGDGFVADVSRETLSLTSLGDLESGAPSISKALTLATRLGGHLVSGHVDWPRHGDRAACGRAVGTFHDGIARRTRALHRTQVLITVDGTSLTVNAVVGRRFELNIVPHTLQETIMDDVRAGAPGQSRGGSRRALSRAPVARRQGRGARCVGR